MGRVNICYLLIRVKTDWVRSRPVTFLSIFFIFNKRNVFIDFKTILVK